MKGSLPMMMVEVAVSFCPATTPGSEALKPAWPLASVPTAM